MGFMAGAGGKTIGSGTLSTLLSTTPAAIGEEFHCSDVRYSVISYDGTNWSPLVDPHGLWFWHESGYIPATPIVELEVLDDFTGLEPDNDELPTAATGLALVNSYKHQIAGTAGISVMGWDLAAARNNILFLVGGIWHPGATGVEIYASQRTSTQMNSDGDIDEGYTLLMSTSNHSLREMTGIGTFSTLLAGNEPSREGGAHYANGLGLRSVQIAGPTNEFRSGLSFGGRSLIWTEGEATNTADNTYIAGYNSYGVRFLNNGSNHDRGVFAPILCIAS